MRTALYSGTIYSGNRLLDKGAPSRVTAKGLELEIKRLESGKWSMYVNGVEFHFKERPEFTIP